MALVAANTRDLLYVFSKDGRCSRIGIHEIPADGSKKVSELTGFQGRDAIAAALPLPRALLNGEGGYLCFVTMQGMVKRVAVSDVQGNTGGEFPVPWRPSTTNWPHHQQRLPRLLALPAPAPQQAHRPTTTST